MSASQHDGEQPFVSVVLPAHNEISLLGSTVVNLATGLSDRGLSYELVVVENGSHDGTLRLARMLAAQIPSVRVLTLGHGDYGAALATGFEAARGRYVVNFDVDYYDLAFLDVSLARLASGEASMVLASKRAPGSSDGRPIARRALTAGFAAVLRAAVGLQVSDAHGMKAMVRESAAPFVRQCHLRGSLFDVELVVRTGRAGLVVQEVPAVVFERRPPRTSVALRSLESLLGVFRLRALLAREARSEAPAAKAREAG
ncbi:MAG: hypothetical protein JWM85_728 [Acidimicrobiaceae bacterium]|nr:hypothetical protein [Acidimicrobiaceae bacterium]